MNIYTEINKAWATLFGFKVESDEATFNDKPIYWNNNAVANWDDLLSAKPSDLKQSAGVAEVPNTKTYDELMTAENFYYSAFNWTNEHGTRLGFSLGNLYVTNTGYYVNTYFVLNSNGVRLYFENNEILNIYENNGLGFYGSSNNWNEIILYSVDATMGIDDVYREQGGDLYGCFYTVYDDVTNPLVLAFLCTYDVNTSESTLNCYVWDTDEWLVTGPDWDLATRCSFYFDDGAHLPEGVEWNEELASYFVPKVKETETTTILTQTTATQAMLGAQIMTHASLWGMGIGCACFIIGIFKLFARSLSRR